MSVDRVTVTVAPFLAAAARPDGTRTRSPFRFLRRVPRLLRQGEGRGYSSSPCARMTSECHQSLLCVVCIPSCAVARNILSEITQVYDPGPRPGDSVRSAAEALRVRAASCRWEVLQFHGKGCPRCATAAGEIAAAPASAFCLGCNLGICFCLRSAGALVGSSSRVIEHARAHVHALLFYAAV